MQSTDARRLICREFHSPDESAAPRTNLALHLIALPFGPPSAATCFLSRIADRDRCQHEKRASGERHDESTELGKRRRRSVFGRIYLAESLAYDHSAHARDDLEHRVDLRRPTRAPPMMRRRPSSSRTEQIQ
jgi:hypothetical protein